MRDCVNRTCPHPTFELSKITFTLWSKDNKDNKSEWVGGTGRDETTL